MALVNFYAAAKEAAGSASLKIEVGSIKALIADLSQRDPKLAKLLPTCSYLLNGQACEDLNHPILEGDVVDVLPQFAGG